MHSHALPHRRVHSYRDPESAERALMAADTERVNDQERESAKREALYVAGRLTVAIVFIGSAVGKAAAFDPIMAGRLGAVFWLSIVLELVCGALLAVGLFSRQAATVLLLWIGVGIVFFHGDLSVDVNRVFTLANLAIAGGLFVFIAQGGGLLSVDRWRETRVPEVARSP